MIKAMLCENVTCTCTYIQVLHLHLLHYLQSFAKLLTPLSKNGVENVSTFILVTQMYQSSFSPPPYINVDVLFKMIRRGAIFVNGGLKVEKYDTFNFLILSVGVSKHFANDCGYQSICTLCRWGNRRFIAHCWSPPNERLWSVFLVFQFLTCYNKKCLIRNLII